jgi:hypothetical protein
MSYLLDSDAVLRQADEMTEIAFTIREADRLITMGMSYTAAARAVGVPPTTMREWRSKMDRWLAEAEESEALKPVSDDELEDPFRDAPF